MAVVGQIVSAWLSCCGDWEFPMELPLAAVIEGGEGGRGFGVGGGPALAGAFQAAGGHFAARFGGARADVPVLFQKRRVVDHVAPLDDVVNQAVGRLAFLRTLQRLPPGAPLLPGA